MKISFFKASLGIDILNTFYLNKPVNLVTTWKAFYMTWLNIFYSVDLL